MICGACNHKIDFGSTRIFSGQIVCDHCFVVLTTNSATPTMNSKNSSSQITPEVYASETSTPTQDNSAFLEMVASFNRNNEISAACFWIGIGSVFLYQIGILPLLGIVFGIVGLSASKEPNPKKWMVVTGLTLNVIFLLMSVRYWAGTGESPSQHWGKSLAPVQQAPRDPNVPFRLNRRRSSN
jgi:hypothetical protein